MKNHYYYKVLLPLLLFPFIALPSNTHGTVITDDIKLWAAAVSLNQPSRESSNPSGFIGILSFENQTRQPNMDILEQGVPLLLLHDLQKISSIKTVSREKAEALMKATGTTPVDLRNTDTAIKLGKALGVEHVITGQILKPEKDSYSITASIFHVSSSALVRTVASQGRLFSDLRAMEKKLLLDITASLNISVSGQEKEQIDRAVTQNMNALGLFLQAVTKSDQGQYAAAKELYAEALKEDPDCTLAAAAIQELSALGLPQPIEAYSKEAAPAQKPLVEKGGARHDTRDPEEREPETDLFFSEVVTEPDVEIEEDPEVPLSILHIRTDATWDMAVDPDSLQNAIDDIAQDTDLRELTDSRVTIPGNFHPEGFTFGFPGTWTSVGTGTDVVYNDGSGLGLQTLGQDGYAGTPQLLLDSTTLERINSNGLLAYAVQREEDRLNRKIIEMHDNLLVQSALYTAEKYKGIRDRDAWLLQKADAQAGRVLRDIDGNWVRVQQYVLRPDAETVQMLNVSLRSGESPLSGLSAANWTTTFSEGYTGDLRRLPWSSWLNTQETVINGQAVRFVSGTADTKPPLLESMSITFTSPGNESLNNQRTFADTYLAGTIDYRQQITGESLQIRTASTDSVYQFAAGSTPGAGEFIVSTAPSTVSGFSYLLGDSQDLLNVHFYVLGNGDTSDSRGERAGFRDTLAFTDIWDALRVNEAGAQDIGYNSLEIRIDPQMKVYEKPIDSIYIPLSGMVWKEDPLSGEGP